MATIEVSSNHPAPPPRGPIPRTIPPSWYTRHTQTYRQWCLVTVCSECGSIGKYEDAHPAEPCRFCGGSVRETVGRWRARHRPWWAFWRAEVGEWVLR